MDFETWKKACNKIVEDNLGLSIDELPDSYWRDYYTSGLEPQVAVECAIEDSWYDEPEIRGLFD